MPNSVKHFHAKFWQIICSFIGNDFLSDNAFLNKKEGYSKKSKTYTMTR